MFPQPQRYPDYRPVKNPQSKQMLSAPTAFSKVKTIRALVLFTIASYNLKTHTKSKPVFPKLMTKYNKKVRQLTSETMREQREENSFTASQSLLSDKQLFLAARLSILSCGNPASKGTHLYLHQTREKSEFRTKSCAF